MSQKFFCAIPARGGSERLSRKNLVPIAGKPMITYSIEAALQTELFDSVYVCTDDPEIAEEALRSGAKVPALVPADLAGGMVPSHLPCQWMRDRVAPESEVLLCLQPTSPLRTAADIVAGVQRYEQGDVDFVLTVTAIDPHYFHWAVAPDEEQAWQLFFGERFMIERPLLPSVYRPNGSIKIGRVDALRQKGHFFGSPFGTVITPEERSVHVATAFDLVVCEALFARRIT